VFVVLDHTSIFFFYALLLRLRQITHQHLSFPVSLYDIVFLCSEHAIASEEKTRAAPEQGETPQSLFDPELLNRITPEETNVLVGKWIRVLEEKPEEVVDKGSQ
jgi:tRNA G10  N-methylase Trm11